VKVRITVLLFCCLAYTSILFAQEGAGNTLHFDGNSTRVQFDGFLNSTKLPVSLSYWVKLENTPEQFIPVFWGCYAPEVTYYNFWSIINNEKLGAAYGDGTGALVPQSRRSISATFTNSLAGQWIHCAYVIRGAQDMDIYLNGVNVKGDYSGSGESTMVNGNSCTTEFGFSSNNTGLHYLYGSLDQMLIWDKALTEQEVRNLMCAPNIPTNSLIGEWKFDEVVNHQIKSTDGSLVGKIMGTETLEVSGAAIGDSSWFSYWDVPVDSFQVKIEGEQITIKSDDINLIGYQIYKVNSLPNTSTGIAVNYSFDHYFGIKPIYIDASKSRSHVYFSGSCGSVIGYHRNGNDGYQWTKIGTDDQRIGFDFEHEHFELTFSKSSSDVPDFSTSINICPGDTRTLDVTMTCPATQVWSDGSKGPTLEISSAGEYWVDVTMNGVTKRSFFEVTENEGIGDYFAYDEYEICINDLPLFIDQSKIDGQKIIKSSQGFRNDSIYNFGPQWVTYYDGCKVNTDSVQVVVKSYSPTPIANVFTPNNDGMNERFEVPDELIGSELKIFDRYGEVVYSNTNYQNTWNGGGLPVGVYYYHIYDQCTDNQIKGWVQIIR